MESINERIVEPTMIEVLEGSPELTSYGSGCQDISVEYFYQPPGETSGQNINHHILAINVGKTYDYESELNDRYCRGKFVAGNISLYPARMPMPYRWHQNNSILYLNLSEELLERNCSQLSNVDRIELVTTHNTRDPLLQQIGLALRTDFDAGSPGGEIYATTMANAVAVHLLQYYSSQQIYRPQASGGLSPHKLKKITRHIEEHLEEKILLADLAAIAQLSEYHFARAFKQSTGSSPHQYIIKTRIDRAQQLLQQSDLEINDGGDRLWV